MAAPARDFCQDVFCTNFNQDFVQNYLLTFSQKSVIIKLQRARGNEMIALICLLIIFLIEIIFIIYDSYKWKKFWKEWDEYNKKWWDDWYKRF